MRNKKWIESWKNEIDKKLPELDDGVLSTPIPKSESAPRGWLSSLYTLLLGSAAKKICAAACALVLVSAIVLVFALGGRSECESSVYTIDVNPSVVFVCDEEGRVTKMLAANDDADKVIGTSGFTEANIGRHISEVSVEFVRRCNMLGFVDGKGDIVRITRTGAEVEDSTVSALQEYFKSSGAFVAVLSESIPDNEISGRVLGYSGNGVDGLVEYLEQTTAAYAEREVICWDETELSQKYKDVVLYGNFKEMLLAKVEKSLDNAKAKHELLIDIKEINSAIEENEENPLKNSLAHLLLSKNYWEVLAAEVHDEYSNEFAALMDAAEQKIAAYNAISDASLESKTALEIALVFYDSAAYEALTNGFSIEMSNDEFDLLLNIMYSLLSTDGEQVAWMESISGDLPSTTEEYLSRLNGVNEAYAESKISEYVEGTPISDYEYALYIEEIIERYGSLSKYFYEKVETMQ